MARRGRKRKTGPRHKCGKVIQRRPKDLGTPESNARRIELVGGADPALASTALGILYANGIIDRAQMDAGFMYAKLRNEASREFFDFPRQHPSISRYNDLVAGHISSESVFYEGAGTEAPQCEYTTIDESLRAISSTCRNEVYNTAVENRVPGWFAEGRVVLIRPSWVRRREQFILGLNQLCEFFMVRAAA